MHISRLQRGRKSQEDHFLTRTHGHYVIALRPFQMDVSFKVYILFKIKYKHYRTKKVFFRSCSQNRWQGKSFEPATKAGGFYNYHLQDFLSWIREFCTYGFRLQSPNLKKDREKWGKREFLFVACGGGGGRGGGGGPFCPSLACILNGNINDVNSAE